MWTLDLRALRKSFPWYIQNRMGNLSVGILSKFAYAFYNKLQHAGAKNVLFGKDKVQDGSRLIKRIGRNKKTNNIHDNIVGFTEVGLDVLDFGVTNAPNLSSTSLDSFTLAKSSMNFANGSASSQTRIRS